MEIDEFESPAQSAANGVMCAARGNRRTTRPAVRRARQGSCYARHNTLHDRTGRASRYGRRQPAHAGSVRGPRPGSGSPVPGKELRRPAANRASACAESAVPEKRPKRNPQQEKRPMPGGTAAEAATEGKAAAEAAAGEKTDAVWESRHARTASAAARSKPMAMPQRKVRKPRAYNSPTVARRAAAAWPP